MQPEGRERRKAHSPDEEFQGLATRSLREGVPVDQLELRLKNPDGTAGPDAERVDELRAGAKGKLLAMAGYTTEKAQAELRPAEAEISAAELSPEQIWLGEFQTRFDALSKLHEGIEWSDVEKSLLADPESMKKLQALDEKGHKMNVFGEEGDEFIFVSAWDKYEQVAADHRNIAYDPEGQELAEEQGYQPNGNAVSIIARIMGVKEDEAGNYLADTKFHEQLREAIAVNGREWLKTDAATRKTGRAFAGDNVGVRRYLAGGRDGFGSFRAALRVKKA